MNSLLFRSLLALVLAGAVAPLSAQTPAGAEQGPLPAWVVPVLRLVSSTHVEPTTGVVLSSGGLVLVPMDFGSASDEIVVLDGGTDIVRNGRPARVERKFPELGLKVLAVDGLARPGAPLVAGSLEDGAAIVLAAFPPAERIEQGEPPLHQAAVLRVDPAGDARPAEALPNVTGAVLDACGNLAGYGLAEGVQDMAPAAGTQYRWKDALERVRQALGLTAAAAVCEPGGTAEAEAEEPETEAAVPPENSTAEEPEEAESEQPEQPPEELPPLEEEAENEPGSEAVSDHPAAEAEESRSSGWWWLIAALLAFAGGFALHRLRQSGSPGSAEAETDETETAPQAPATPAGESSLPGLDSCLTLRGHYADGRPLQISAAVNAQGINLEIGRGSGADLVLDSPAVSRRHARLGYAGALTLSDLGSANGSSINGVPCLEGEIMYLESGDTVILGDVRFTVELLPTADGRGEE